MLSALLAGCVILAGLFFPVVTGSRPAAAAEYRWTSTGGEVNVKSISSMAWDGAGLYACAGDQGINHYDPETGAWTYIGGWSPMFDGVKDLAWDGSGLYAATEMSGIRRYNPATGLWTDTGSEYHIVYIQDLAWDRVSLTLYCAAEYGIWRYDPATNHWSETQLPEPIVDRAFCIAWDESDSVLYVGGIRLGPANAAKVWRYDPASGSWTDMTGIVSGEQVRSMNIDPSFSTLYVATDAGIWSRDMGTGRWTDIKAGLGGKKVLCMAWDVSGLYAGLSGHGVWRRDHATGAWEDTGGGLSGTINSLAWGGDYLYAGPQQNGAWRTRPGYSISAIADPAVGGLVSGDIGWNGLGGGIINTTVYSLARDGIGVYIGTDGSGVWHYNPATEGLFNTGGGISAMAVRSLAWDGAGLYAGTFDDGVWCYDPNLSSWTDLGGGAGGWGAYSLAWTGSELFSGTAGHGVWRYDPGAGTWTDTGGAVSGDYVEALAWTGSELYAATSSHGVWRHDPGAGTWTDTGGGMSAYIVVSLAWDGAGLYTGTWGHGVWRYDPAAGTWTDTGGAVSGCNVWSVLYDGSWLYAGTGSYGVWRYDPGKGAWTGMDGAVSGYIVRALEHDGPDLYAGIENEGAWRGRTVRGHGETVSLTAYPYAAGHYHFVNWTEAGSEVSTDPGYSFTATADRALTAHFAPDTYTWYLAEGCTAGGFETWALVLNPNDYQVTVDLTLISEEGSLKPPGLQGMALPAATRVSLDLGGYVSGYDVSTEVTSYGGDVVVERAMYGSGRSWGTCSIGARAAASRWYLAEGCTDGGFETWVLVLNPNDHPVTVDIELMTVEGPAPGPTGVTLPARSRRSFDLGGFLGDYEVSAEVASYGGDVVVERAMYGSGRSWGTCSIGARAAASRWYLAEGCTDGGFETWVLVLNPNDHESTVDITLMTGSCEYKFPELQNVTVPARSRQSFDLGGFLSDYEVSAEVSSDSGDVVVERAMYGAQRAWGAASVGAVAPFSSWHLAEGSTAGGMETWVLVLNPGYSPVTVDLTLMTGDGGVKELGETVILPRSRRSFDLGGHVNDFNVSTTVTSGGGEVVCDRSMYGEGRSWAQDSPGYGP